jgi:CRP-like cAMP-binding protein
MTVEGSETRAPRSPIPPGVWERLAARGQERALGPGQAAFSQGDAAEALFMVVSGRVKVVRVTTQGNEHILCVRGPGESFCPVALLDGGPQLGTAVAMGEVRLRRLPKQDFADLCQGSPEILSAAQGECLAEVRYLLRRLEAVAFRSVRQRVAHALLALSRQAGGPEPCVTLRLTQSVSRALTQLERQGAVAVSRGRVEILNRALLEAAADPGTRSGVV